MAKNIRNLVKTMDRMHLERDQMGDVTFLVEGQRIRAHRIVLATQSPKYRAQFYGPNPDVGEIYIPNVSAASFDVFLQLFYKKTVDLTMDNIETVLDLAKQSLVDDFVETCVIFLKYKVKANNFCVAYRLANLYDIESLRLICEQHISTNSIKFFASDDFLRCDRQMLLQILDIDALNCKETDVLHACIARARVQCKRINLDAGKPENLRTALGDAIYQIRFSSFSAEEFADLHKSMEGFFTADEVVEILYMVGKLKDFKSQKFNQKPRMLQIEPQTKGPSPSPSRSAAWSLELDRFAHKEPSMGVDVAGMFNFSFGCSDPIRLHGIALCIYFDEAELKKFSEILQVRVISDNDATNNDWGKRFKPTKCKVYRNKSRRNETLVIFEQPIERVIEFACAIELPSKRLNYEFELRYAVQADDMAFQFKDGKWMKRLFFDKYAA